jgi:hypothetical protein
VSYLLPRRSRLETNDMSGLGVIQSLCMVNMIHQEEQCYDEPAPHNSCMPSSYTIGQLISSKSCCSSSIRAPSSNLDFLLASITATEQVAFLRLRTVFRGNLISDSVRPSLQFKFVPRDHAQLPFLGPLRRDSKQARLAMQTISSVMCRNDANTHSVRPLPDGCDILTH